MHETSFSYSHLERPAPGATLPAGRHVLRGWVWPKAGGPFVDVRARIGTRTFPGVHGLPRADLAAHFKTGRPFALAEFDVVVDLAPGPAEVVLEALEIDGSWLAFQAVSHQVVAASQPAEVATPRGELRWHEFGRALQSLLREQRRHPRQPVAELARALVKEIPYPRYLRHPPPPFRGHLDEPASLAQNIFGRVPVFGYLFHETQPIRRVLATFDLQTWQTLDQARPSPSAAAHFPQFAHAVNCGLHGFIDLPAQLPAPAALRLYAELPDGSLHLASVLRTRVSTNEDEKVPYAAQDAVDFGETVAALKGAMAARRMVVIEDEEMHREIARIGDDYRRRAPRTLPPVPALQPGPITAAAPLPARVLLVTHNLNLEGAPLFLLEYGRHLAAAGVRLDVLSPAEGPLRARFEEFGARTMIVDAAPVFAAKSEPEAQAAIEVLATAVDFGAFDLLVANTFTTFWAVHAAKRSGRRVLMYVHESTTPVNFYADRVHCCISGLACEAFGLADCVSFTTAATRSYHTDYGRPENHRLTPGWVEVARIDAWRAAHSRLALRAHLGLGPDDLLVSNIGTVCDRKGQHVFARAVDLLLRRDPGLTVRTQFLMLGGRDTVFDAQLRDLLAHLGRDNLVVHPETADYLPYFVAADLFVCSSFEESSPRVILEAMACGVPILSSRVHGVPELVRPEEEAVLVPAGDTAAWCDALARMLRSPDFGAGLARLARARVESHFSAATVLPRHAALAAEVAAGASTRAASRP
jgi:glycosyltransferase involved in cell wall biosynthesis